MTDSELQKKIDSYGFTWFLDSGSLLGLIREGRFLRGDDDIDIGVIHQSGDLDAFIRELKALGFRAVRFYWAVFYTKSSSSRRTRTPFRTFWICRSTWNETAIIFARKRRFARS